LNDRIPTKPQSSASAQNAVSATLSIFIGLEEARRENIAHYAKTAFRSERRIK